MTTELHEFHLPLRVDENGDVRVGGTRVLLDMIVYEYRKGRSPEQIVEAFDVLELPDVYAAIAYYLRNRAAVDQYVRRREEAGEQLRREIESRQGPTPLRETLRSRIGKAG
jgi:uncharacterized protein (DUF433 family)